MELSSSDSREITLVVQAARAHLSGSHVHALLVMLDQPIDWCKVESIADNHSILPLLTNVLKQYAWEQIPQKHRSHLEQQWRKTAHGNLARLQAWQALLQAFQAASIPVISLKGPALSLSAYQEIALREFTDLDLLVQPADVARACDLLLRSGYRVRFPNRKNIENALWSKNCQMDFIHETSGIPVDLHWSVLHEMFSYQMPAEQLFAASRIEHHGDISFLSLSPEDMTLYLCAHGTKHSWKNLGWLCDLACWLQAASTLDWNLCMRRAEASNMDCVLKHSLLLAEQTLGPILPATVRDACDLPRMRELALKASALLWNNDGKPPSSIEELHYQLAVAGNWIAGLRLLRGRFFTPTEEDWDKVPLPQGLFFLYPAVRPVRLLFDFLDTR